MDKRIEKLRAQLPANADAIIISDPINVRYISGVNFTDGYAVVSKDRAMLFADSRYIEVAEKNAREGMDVILYKGLETLTSECTGIGTLAYEDRYVTCAALESLKGALEGTEFIPCGKLIEGLREFKDEYEIECITAAQRIAEKALDHVLGFITPERTEVEVALELEFTMRSLGASGTSFDTIAVSGKASSMPHGEPRMCKLEKGFLTMDFGALYNGYCSDMTRTVVIGKADDEMKEMYNLVLESQNAAIDAVKAGKKCRDIDRIARDKLDERYPGAFGHGLGHGVGMYIHESPTVSFRSDETLRPGHIITIEPGVYLAGKYGVRIEDMLAVTETGAINITKAPKNLIEI